MSRAMLAALAVAATVIAGAPTRVQADRPGTPRAQQDIFRAATDRVLLSVTVTDARGQFVSELGRDDFLVFEDGRPQTISYFSAEPLPIALSLLLDSSESMQGKMPIAQDAAIGFVRRLRTGDLAQVIDFDTRATIVQTFTNDRAALEAAIRRTSPSGSTSLYQSLYIALSELMRDRARAAQAIRREAIVVLSDGEDNESLVDHEAVLDLSRRAGVTVYAIGLRSRQSSSSHEFNQAEYVLRTLSRETGGQAFFVTEASELPSVYGQIASELGGQYGIGYQSTNTRRDGGWRKVAVRLTSGGMAARTKSGYFAPKDRP
jgi:VWFA-related protein